MLSWLSKLFSKSTRSKPTGIAGGNSLSVNKDVQARISDFLVANSKQVIFWTDEQGNFLDFNHATCKMLGYSRDELKSMTVRDIDPNITDESHEAMLEVLEKEGSVTVQTQPRTKDGSHFSMEFKVSRLVVDGRVYLCTYGDEIVLEKQLRNRVLEATATGMPLAEILSLIVELAEKTRTGMIGSIQLIDESGCFVNGACTQLPEAFLKIIEGLKPGPAVGSCGTAAYTRTSVMVDNILTSPLWAPYLDAAGVAGVQACWSEPIFSTSGEVVGTIAMYFRKPQIATEHDRGFMKTFAHLAGIAIEGAQKQELLSTSEIRYRSLIQSTSTTVWTTSPKGKFVTRQRSWESYTGQPWEQHRGYGWTKMIHADDQERLITEWIESTATKKTYSSFGRLWHAKSGDYRYFEVLGVPIIRDNKVVEWAGYTTDVHDRKVAENKYRRSQAILAQAQEVAHLGSWAWDFESDLVQWTEEFSRLHGLDPKNRQGSFQDLLNTVFIDDRSRVYESIKRAIQTTTLMPLEYRIIRRKGSMKAVFSKMKFETDKLGNNIGMMGTVLDVTGLRKTEKALRKSERELRTITDSLPVMIAYIDRDYCFQFNNAKYESVFGKSRSDILGTHLRELVGDQVFQEVKPHFDNAFRGKTITYEQRSEYKGTSYIREIRLIPDIGSTGIVNGVYTTSDDITDRRSLEKEVLNIAAEEQRRIGQDLHDGMGQELTGLGMIADTLLLSLSRRNADEKPIAEKMARGIKRALRQVKSLARGLNPVDVSSEGLRSALTLMAAHVQDLYRINCNFTCELSHLPKDHQVGTQLFRIAQEATTNAAKHADASNIHISLTESQNEMVLQVTDDGLGIEPSRQRNPGMGLRSMNYRAGIIGGQLQIAPRYEGGTQVVCRIPRDGDSFRHINVEKEEDVSASISTSSVIASEQHSPNSKNPDHVQS